MMWVSVVLFYLNVLVTVRSGSVKQDDDNVMVSCEGRRGWYSCGKEEQRCISRSQVR